MAHFGMNGNSSSIFKQFGNLRHTKKPGQYDEEYVEECFSSMHFLASQDVDELILHKMIFHSVIVCSAFEEIMVRYDKLARQKEGTETSQERSGNGDTPGKTSTDGPPVSATGKSTEPTNGRNSDISPERNSSSTEPGKTEHKSDTLPPYLIGHEEGIDKGTGKDGKSENFDALPWYLKALAIFGGIVGICVGVAIISLVIKTVCFPQNCQGNHTGPSCTYQAVFRECTDQSGSDLSTDSYTEGGRSTTDESTVDGNETPDAAQGTTKIEISSSSESIKGNRKVVKKSTFNSGNTTINIEKVENLLLGDLDGKVPAVVEGARNIAGMIEDLTAEATSDETEMDSKDTDIIQSEQKTVVDQRGCDLVHPNQQQTVSGEPDVTGSGQKGLTGEEFAKGRNELLSQVTVTNFSEHMKSVGALIYNGDVIGTVFRAGDCFIITAFHVVRQIIDINQNGQYDFSLLERGNVWVNFNASVAEPACVVYRVCHQFSSNDPGLDFAVLRIINPWQLPNKMFLDKYNFDRLPARMLSGIGYGHPDQDSKCKKNLDPNCQIIFAIDDRITECRAWLEQNIIYYQNHVRRNGVNPALVANSYIGFDTLRNIFLDITMEHGGSGSPFLDNNGRVVGILTHGHPEFCFKLPKLIQLNFPKGKRFESVLRLDYIYNHIFERDPELAGKLFG